MGLQEGLTFEVQHVVSDKETAHRMGNDGFHVLATPVIFAWFEEAARKLAAAHLEPGQGTVGSVVNMKHLAATPIGLMVRVVAHLKQIDGRRLVFWIEAFDEVEKIAECHHERFIVDLARFHDKVGKKLGGPAAR